MTRGKPRAIPRTIRSAAASGSQVELLLALRDGLAGEFDEAVPARDLAALTKRLMEIVREIEAVDAAGRGDGIGGCRRRRGCVMACRLGGLL